MPLKIGVVGAELARLARQQAVVDHGAALGQAVGEAQHQGAADRIDREPDRRAAGRVAHARGQIVAVDHDHVGADRLQRLPQRAAAHHVDRADAVRLGEADQAGADARVGGILDHPVARLQCHVAAQHQAARSPD